MSESLSYTYRSVEEEIELLEASLLDAARGPAEAAANVTARHEANQAELYRVMSEDSHYCRIAPQRREQLAKHKYSLSVEYATTRVTMEAALHAAQHNQTSRTFRSPKMVSHYTQERLQDLLTTSWYGFETRLQAGARTDDYRSIISALTPNDDPLGRHLLEVTQVAETADPSKPLPAEVTDSIRRSYDVLLQSPAGRYGEAGLRRHALVTQSILDRYAQHRDPVKRQGGEPYRQIVSAMDCRIIEDKPAALPTLAKVAKRAKDHIEASVAEVAVKIIDEQATIEKAAPAGRRGNVIPLPSKTFGDELSRRRRRTVAVASIAVSGALAATVWSAGSAAATPTNVGNNYPNTTPVAASQSIIMVPSFEGETSVSAATPSTASSPVMATETSSGIVAVPVEQNPLTPAQSNTKLATSSPANAAEAAIVSVPSVDVKAMDSGSNAAGPTIDTSSSFTQSASVQNTIFALQTGTSQDALDALAPTFASQGYTKAPDSAYGTAVESVISKIDAKSNGHPNSATIAALQEVQYPATTELVHPKVQTYVGNNGKFVSAMVKYYFDTPAGLGGVDGSTDYGPVTLSDEPTLLASALADVLSPTEQQAMMAEFVPASAQQPTATSLQKAATKQPMTPAKPGSHEAAQASGYRLNATQIQMIHDLGLSQEETQFLMQAIPAIEDGYLIKGYRYNVAESVGQADLESGTGTSTIAKYYNYWGSKAYSNWTGKTVAADGTEQRADGSMTGPTEFQWKAYDRPGQAVDDYAQTLGLSWYQDELSCHATPKQALQALEFKLDPETCKIIGTEPAWATDHDYVNKVLARMKAHHIVAILKAGDNYKKHVAPGDRPAKHEASAKSATTAGEWLAHRALSFVVPGPFQERGVMPMTAYTTKAFRRQEADFVGGTATTTDGTDCGAAVRTFVGKLDPGYIDLGTSNQQAYVRNSPLWQTFENVGPDFKLHPGDIFVNPGHTYMYVGKQSNGKSVVEASQFNHGPQLDATPYFYHDGSAFTVARYVGPFDSATLANN